MHLTWRTSIAYYAILGAAGIENLEMAYGSSDTEKGAYGLSKFFEATPQI